MMEIAAISNGDGNVSVYVGISAISVYGKVAPRTLGFCRYKTATDTASLYSRDFESAGKFQ